MAKKTSCIKKSVSMNAREFFFLVSSMRDAQKRYFKNRDQVTLRACKKLESEVDAEIARVKQIVGAQEK